MCDQLSTIGVEFNLARMTEIFMDVLGYSAVHPFPAVAAASKISSWTSFLWKKPSNTPLPWACDDICRHPHLVRDAHDHNSECKHPHGTPEKLWGTARPWGMGQIRVSTSKLTNLGGDTVRLPGLFMRTDSESNTDTDQPLLNTSERIHSCVRVRLACAGLGVDDKEAWRCRGLFGSGRGQRVWRLQPGSALSPPAGDSLKAPRPRELDQGYPEDYLYPVAPRDAEWQWVYDKKSNVAGEGHARVPQVTALPEEPLTGYWERYLLNLTAGHPDVWRYALQHPPLGE